MNPNKDIRVWLARIFLTVMAIVMLLPMVQTFLYSFSSIPEMKAYFAQHDFPGPV